MAGAVVYKLVGSGNDFVFVDGRDSRGSIWTVDRIRAICDRRNGVGADGFAVLEPAEDPDHVRFHFHNRDGSRAAMCGNGALCAARLAVALDLASPHHICLLTDAGAVRASVIDPVQAQIELPSVAGLSRPNVELEVGELDLFLTRVGVPHLVVRVEDAANVRVAGRGRALRTHPAMEPEGANVNFVSLVGSGWILRTYERGVEGETPSCGSGAVAVAAVLARSGLVRLPWTVRTASGRDLNVGGVLSTDGVLKSPWLIGEARIAFRAVW